MNRVFIHNNNLCDDFNNRLLFAQNTELDKYISESLLPEIYEKNPNIIFIKDALSEQYIDLLGLRVAMHIRLSDSKIKLLPIVILSELTLLSLMKLSPLAKILLTKNVFLTNNRKEDIENFDIKAITPFFDSDYKEKFLDFIEIEAPKDYLTHHDIANEWSIYKWANLLNIESTAINTNKEKIKDMLYFKYLKEKYKIIDKKKVKKIQKPLKKGNILFIDDEWNKGWNDILKQTLDYIGEDNFKTFKYNYLDKTNFNLIVQLKYKNLREQIKNSDVIILDLRLTDSDHTHNNVDDYSGVKILKEIHKINAGIQVIMFTATSQSVILDKLYEYKILGYIKKEHPDDFSISTNENINKLVQLVDKGLDRKYLKEIFMLQNSILDLSIFQKLVFSFDMTEKDRRLLELKNTISIIFNTLESNISKPFTYGMLTIFKCIEIINDYFIYENWNRQEKRNEAFWIHDNTKITGNGNVSVSNKIKNIINHLNLQQVENINLYINQLTCSRNHEIHAGEIKNNCRDYVVKHLNENNILKWFEIISIIVKNIK